MKKNCLLLIIGVALALVTSCKKKSVDNPPVPNTGDVMTMPYTVSFENNFGTYATYNVVGDQVWHIDYSSAVMSGYEDGSRYDNEDWLVSSPVKIKGVEHAKIVMSYAAQYQGVANDITMQVSTDYEAGNSPTTATWTALPNEIVNTEGWTFTNMEFDLDAYLNSTITVAVKYTSTTDKARTIEVKTLSIEEGQASGGGGGGQGGEIQDMPYIQSFATSFGTYTTKDVFGDESWMIDYSTAKMTGYVGGENRENEDWLISSPVNVTGVEHAKIVMEYICRYFSSVNNDITIWASEDYVFDEMPGTATWTQIAASFTEGSNWNDFATTEISLDEFIGKTITIAVKYLSNTTKAGTIEVKSITVMEGEAGGVTPPTPPTPGPGSGSGTAEDPYNVASGIALQSEEPIAWVQGYIVGAVKSGLTSVSGNDDVNWSAPFDLNTNVVIADDADCHEIANCIIVNLPNNKPLRAQVNLVDNPDNLGKLLAVNGKLRKYFGQAGLRDSGGTENDFVLEGGVTPPPTPGTEIFSETFASGQGMFSIQDVVMPSELTYVWAHAANYSCMKASAYVGQAYATESWLISPDINISGVSTATLKFDQAVNYASPEGALSVMITTDFTDDVNTTEWTELTLSAWPAGNNWTFMNSIVDLTSYVGKHVTIAFKYTSTTSAAATWEIKNFVISE
jgi:hypothetical protein